jgi:hypothetical protein
MRLALAYARASFQLSKIAPGDFVDHSATSPFFKFAAAGQARRYIARLVHEICPRAVFDSSEGANDTDAEARIQPWCAGKDAKLCADWKSPDSAMSELLTPISSGELIDKITILEIKSARIHDAAKLANVRNELNLLNATWNQHPASRIDIVVERGQLKAVNEALWDIEDRIRLKEKAQAFDTEFIELARSVYFRNDERAAFKRAINLKLGSKLVEEKSYQDYAATKPV